MKYLIIFFFSIWSLFSKTPEPKVILNGSIKDKATLEALIACEVRVKNKATGTIDKVFADSKGQFKLNLSVGEFEVIYNYIGYRSLKESYAFKTLNDTVISKEIFLTKKIVEKDSAAKLTFRKELGDKEIRHKGSRGLSKDSYSTETIGGAYSSSPTLSIARSSVEVSSEFVSGHRVTYSSGGINGEIKAGILTAGEINDFSKWTLWEDLSKTELCNYVKYWGIAPKHRFSVLVTNENKSPLTDITVVLKDPNGLIVWQSHTDNTGKAELWANLYDSTDLIKGKYSIDARFNGKTFTIKNASSFSFNLNKLVIPAACSQPLNMDIVFAVDATGSMGDEISYLQAELYDVIEKVKQGNPSLNLNMGSVFYRDKEDAYLTVTQDLTSDIAKVMDFMKVQSADGGGDEPEGVDAAMEVAIGQFKWREEARARVMFLVLDASPHHDKESMDKLEKYTKMAAEKGIRIVPIVCSGIDKAGEYLMRSMALATNGNYIFLTDHSGIGNGHIAPSTDKFEVETLNVLLIRLLQQYIFMPECNQTVNTAHLDSLQQNQPDSTSNDSSFVHNPNPAKDSTGQIDSKPDDWFLKYYPNPCRGILKVDINANISELYIADINGKLLMKIAVASDEHYKEIDLTSLSCWRLFFEVLCGWEM